MKNNKSSFAKKIAKLSLGLAACAAVTVTAYALVDFDPSTGTGFVGKGDVQLAFGWNNTTLQQNANGVSFSYISSADYEVICEFDTEQGGKDGTKTLKHHIATQSVSSSVALDPKSSSRKNPQGDVTGFNLTGFEGGLVPSGDPIPVVGEACLGQGQGTINPTITDVTLLPGSSSGGLYVNWSGTSVLLDWPILP